MKTLIKSPALNYGDKVAGISLSWGGTGSLTYRYQRAKENLERVFGLQLADTKHSLRSAEWLYENPQAKADDLMESFADDSVKAIFTNIGGDDSIRILPYLDINLIRQHPKIFIGFSDTTINHFSCFKAGLASFYGSSLMVGFAEAGGMHPYEIDYLKKALFRPSPIGIVQPNTGGFTVAPIDWSLNDPFEQPRTLLPSVGWKFVQQEGSVTGRLMGGCLEVLELINGTDHWPPASEWKDCILFLDTADNTPSPAFFKRCLRNFAAQGILENLKGIILGKLINQALEQEYFQTIQTVMAEIARKDMQVITGMDFGHTCPGFTIPIGSLAEINSEKQTFSILEAGVI